MNGGSRNKPSSSQHAPSTSPLVVSSPLNSSLNASVPTPSASIVTDIGQLLGLSHDMSRLAIDPSLMLSLSSHFDSLKHFDSSKLVKELDMMLIYFQDVLRKDKLEQLAGATTILLDTVNTNCSKLKNEYMHLQQVYIKFQLLYSADSSPSSTDPLSPGNNCR